MKKYAVSEMKKEAKNGQFSTVSDWASQSTLTSEESFKILIAISNCCYYTPEQCELETLGKLCHQIFSNISITDREQLSIYYQCIFHITKFLCHKGRIEDVIKLEPLIIPHFVQETDLCNTSVEQTYSPLVKLLSQSVIRSVRAGNLMHKKYLLQVINMSLKAQCTLKSPKELFSLATCCHFYCRELDITDEQVLTFYNGLLELVAKTFLKLEGHSGTIQPLLMKLFSEMLSDFIEGGNFNFCILSMNLVRAQIKANIQDPRYLDGHQMFEAVTVLFPNELKDLQTNIQAAKQILNEFENNHKSTFYNLIGFLEEPLHKIFYYYKDNGSNIWTNLTKNEVLTILKFVEYLTFYLKKSSKKCSCGCHTNKNYEEVLKAALHVTELLSSYIKSHSINIDSCFFAFLVKWLGHYFNIIKKLKDASCKHWSSFYLRLSGYTYNMIIVLHNAGAYYHKELNVFLLRSIFEIEGTKAELRTKKVLSFIFTALAEIEVHTENWIGCLGVAALHCLLYPDESNSILRQLWINIKGKLYDGTSYKELTMVDVLHKERNTLNNIVQIDSILTPAKEVELLIFELTSYKRVWRSRLSMKAVFAHLCKIADVPTLADVIIQVYGEGDIRIHQDMLTLMLHLKDKFEKNVRTEADSKIKLALAILYYYLFDVSFNSKAEKNVEEMEMTMRVMESAKKREVVEPVPKDANDECDVVSAYSSLSLSKFLNVLKLLDTSRELLSSLMRETFDINVFKIITKLLYTMSLQYRLHNLLIASLHCSVMSMECAEKGGDLTDRLLSLSHIIEHGDSKKDFVRSLVDKGDQLSSELQKVNHNRKYDRTLAIFHISKSKLFIYEEPEKSYEAWLVADGICSFNKTKDEFKILRSQLYVILFKLTESCSFIPGEHEREPMTLKLHCAIDIAEEVVKTQIADPYNLSITFDALYELTKTYKLMRLPRDLRAYSKSFLLLAQKLVLPLRSVSLLIFLAYSDVATGKLDHCRIKINGIDDILSLDHVQFFDLPGRIEKEEVNVEKEIDQCADMVRELVLDLPEHFKQYSSSSPILAVDSFKPPPFLTHSKPCLCLMCRSIDFQRLLLQKYHLNALASMYEQDDKVAEEFVAGAVNMYKSLSFNFKNYLLKVSELIPDALIPDFEDVFLEVYSIILYECSFHVSRKGHREEAQRINEALLHALKPKKERYIYLYHDLLLQKTSYLMAIVEEEREKSRIHVNPICLTEAISPNVSKTPSGKSIPMIALNDTLPTVAPLRRKVRKCKLFDTNEKECSPPVEAPKNTRKKQVSKRLSEDEVFVFPKPTPSKAPTIRLTTAEAKIEIFSDDEPKRRTYGKQSAKKLPKPPKSESDLCTGITPKANSNKKQPTKSTGDEPALPIIVSSSAVKKTRSQLLAEKIRASSQLKEKLFKDKPVLSEKVSVHKEKDNDSSSSVVADSPENRVALVKSEQYFEKLKSSMKKERLKREVTSRGVQENLLAASESGSSNSTGAIRKSARKRLL